MSNENITIPTYSLQNYEVVDSENSAETFRETFLLHPNPTHHILNIDIVVKSNAHLLIYDINGKVMIQKQYKSSPIYDQIEVSNFAKGIYFAKLITDSQQFIEKFVVD